MQGALVRWCSVHDVDKEYYADKEDAFNMRNYFNKGGAAPPTVCMHALG